MTFPANIYLFSFLSAGFIAVLGLPAWRYWCRQTGLVDDPGHRKIHHQPVALAGGLAILTAMLLPVVAGGLVVAANLLEPGQEFLLRHGYEARLIQLLAIMAGAVGILLVGWLDDKLELAPAPKFLGQLVVAVLVSGAGIRATLFVESAWFSHLVTILWLLTLINAFNFMDNMNGLCAGCGLIAALAFAAAAALSGQYLVTSLALLVAGALLGFLPYNYPRATAFLGDSGSHLVGYILAVLAILTTFYSGEDSHRSPWAVVSPVMILAVPLIDLTRVVIVRWRLGKPFYVGDNNHLSHHLVRRGFSQTVAVLILWGLAALGAVISFAI